MDAVECGKKVLRVSNLLAAICPGSETLEEPDETGRVNERARVSLQFGIIILFSVYNKRHLLHVRLPVDLCI